MVQFKNIHTKNPSCILRYELRNGLFAGAISQLEHELTAIYYNMIRIARYEYVYNPEMYQYIHRFLSTSINEVLSCTKHSTNMIYEQTRRGE